VLSSGFFMVHNATRRRDDKVAKLQKSFRMRVQNKCDNYSDRMQEKSRNKYLMYQNGSHLKRVMIQL